MNPIRRVLIVQPYGIGDLLFVTPVMRALRLIPTVEKVDLLLGSRTKIVVENNPHIDEIFQIDKDLFHQQSLLKNWKDMAGLGLQLKKNQYDLLLDYSLRGEYAFWGQFFLGIPIRAGFAYKNRAFFHNRRLSLAGGYRDRHVIDYVCDLAEKAGVPVKDRFVEFYLSDKDRKENQVSGSYLVVSPGGGESWGKDAHFKQWPVRFFAQSIEKLKSEIEFEKVLILGSQNEQKLGEELSQLLSIPSENLAGKLSLTQSAALIEKAKLFIGNDGGLVHLAHALRTPVIAFYGPVNPKVYGPYPHSDRAIAVFKDGLECRPCYQNFRYNSACIGRECLQQLLPDDVLQFLQRSSFFSSLKTPTSA